MLKQRHRPPYKRESFPSECSTKKRLSTCSNCCQSSPVDFKHLNKMMKISSILSIVLLIAAVSMTTVSAQWHAGDGGVQWQSNCRYVGDYIALKPSSPEQCGGVCIAQSGCTHFTNGPSPEGDRHCYMYNAANGKESNTGAPGWVCGYIPSRVIG